MVAGHFMNRDEGWMKLIRINENQAYTYAFNPRISEEEENNG